MAVNTSMSGLELDAALKSLLSAMETKNNGKLLYIKDGAAATESAESLFDVVPTN